MASSSANPMSGVTAAADDDGGEEESWQDGIEYELTDYMLLNDIEKIPSFVLSTATSSSSLSFRDAPTASEEDEEAAAAASVGSYSILSLQSSHDSNLLAFMNSELKLGHGFTTDAHSIGTNQSRSIRSKYSVYDKYDALFAIQDSWMDANNTQNSSIISTEGLDDAMAECTPNGSLLMVREEQEENEEEHKNNNARMFKKLVIKCLARNNQKSSTSIDGGSGSTKKQGKQSSIDSTGGRTPTKENAGDKIKSRRSRSLSPIRRVPRDPSMVNQLSSSSSSSSIDIGNQSNGKSHRGTENSAKAKNKSSRRSRSLSPIRRLSRDPSMVNQLSSSSSSSIVIGQSNNKSGRLLPRDPSIISSKGSNSSHRNEGRKRQQQQQQYESRNDNEDASTSTKKREDPPEENHCREVDWNNMDSRQRVLMARQHQLLGGSNGSFTSYVQRQQLKQHQQQPPPPRPEIVRYIATGNSLPGINNSRSSASGRSSRPSSSVRCSPSSIQPSPSMMSRQRQYKRQLMQHQQSNHHPWQNPEIIPKLPSKATITFDGDKSVSFQETCDSPSLDMQRVGQQQRIVGQDTPLSRTISSSTTITKSTSKDVLILPGQSVLRRRRYKELLMKQRRQWQQSNINENEEMVQKH